MKPFLTGHADLVHDVSYDFYGRHVATCSSDQQIKVFKLDKETNEWELSDSWKAHDSSVVSLDWAAPEFGRLCTLNDATGPLFCVKFAPSHLGLRLAALGNDGKLRMYDALESSDLRSWTLTSELSVLPDPPASHLQSDFDLSWCPSRFSTERLAVSAMDRAVIYQRNKQGKLVPAGELPGHKGLIRSIAWAPSIGRWFQLIATGCQDGKLRIYKITENPEADTISSVTEGPVNGNAPGTTESDSTVPLSIELIGEHADHQGEVWSVSWNLTGTILSSSGDDGKVRLWKASYSNEFRCMSVVQASR
ncbi:epoxide hydrolase, soluble (sEH) [Kluyveromyces marxianus]|nr:epoxide hydrolase, soluble (sEH) [Kluyveromyces marxianus]